MLRKLIFKDSGAKLEITLPVTPSSYQVSSGMAIETINIHTSGDQTLAGYATVDNISIDCMFPAKKYPFNVSGAKTDPQYYITKFQNWISKKTVLRFVVSGTKINKPVYVESIAYGEQDGTNDVYATLTLQEHKEMGKVSTKKVTPKSNNSRPASTAKKQTVKTHKVKWGDTLSGICYKYYKNAMLYPKLAKYNSIKNPNLIYVNQIIKIPEESKL